MVFPAAEGATQVTAARVARMGQKRNPAMRAVRQARPQLRMRQQDRIQRDEIMADECLGVIVLVPIYPKRENFLDGQDKNARLRAIMEILSCITSAYQIEAFTSRGEPRFFMRSERRTANPRSYNRSLT